MRRSLLSFLFIPGLLPLYTAAQSLTVQELIDSALHKDYNLANQQLDISLTRSQQQRLKEQFLPRIDASAKDAFLLSSYEVKSPDISIPQLNIATQKGHNRFTTTSNLVSANINASLLLYSGGKVPALRKALTEKERAQTLLMEKDRQEVISEVVAAWDRLALLQQSRRVLDEGEKRLAENKKTADKALSYGLITRYEHQKIEVAQAQLASRIQDYEGRRELVLEQLYLLTNIGKERLAGIANILQPVQAVEADGNIGDRAELKAVDAAIRAGQYQVQAARTWSVPKIQAASSLGYVGMLAGHIRSSQPILQGGEKLSSSTPNINILPLFNIGVGLKWDLFNGREGQREVEEAELELQKTENNRKDITEKLELNLAKCRTDFRVANTLVQLRQTQQQTARNALTQATSEYRTGLIRSSQLIDAEEDFQQAALGYVQAVFDQRRAAVALLKATGRLTVQAIQ